MEQINVEVKKRGRKKLPYDEEKVIRQKLLKKEFDKKYYEKNKEKYKQYYRERNKELTILSRRNYEQKMEKLKELQEVIMEYNLLTGKNFSL
jgi:hypothetical protein